MPQGLQVLAITAGSIAFFHTLLGPDRNLPLIVMAQARKWSQVKTVFISTLCGVGHVLSFVVLGTIGIIFGPAVTRLEFIESYRENIAAWELIAFGLLYFVWGLRRAPTNRPHTHWHSHENDVEHHHEHVHRTEHLHAHNRQGTVNLTA